MITSYKDIFKATSLFAGVQGINILLNLVRSKLAALILGPTGIGLNSIYNEMRELIHTTTNLGMDISGVREISQAFESGDTNKIANSILLTRSWVLLLALIGALICFVLAEPLSWMTFSDFSHTWDFVLLAPSVAFSTLTCGELSILKGLRKIKSIASVSVMHVIAGIVTTIPIYYYWELKGIVPALLLLTITQYIIVLSCSYREYPLHLNFKAQHLRTGFPMLTIGLSFVLAGMISHGTELVIRTYLNNVASLCVVGLYSAGYTIVMTYGGVIFTSLDNDYFPRLSGIVPDSTKGTEVVNKQIEVLLLIVTPLIAIMIVALPIAVPLLFSSKFNLVIPMAQVASLGLLFRAVYLPAGYIPLAAGDSKSFFLLEAISYATILVTVIIGYHYLELLGTGIALAISNLLDSLIVCIYIRWRYGISITKRIVLIVAGASILLCGFMSAIL